MNGKKTGEGQPAVLDCRRFPPGWEASNVEGTGFGSPFPMFPSLRPREEINFRFFASFPTKDCSRWLLGHSSRTIREAFANPARVLRREAGIGRSFIIDPS